MYCLNISTYTNLVWAQLYISSILKLITLHLKKGPKNDAQNLYAPRCSLEFVIHNDVRYNMTLQII